LIATASTSGQETEIAYHYFDQRGDTRAIADGAGNVGFQANYSEYGEITSQSSQLPQYGFVGAHKRITNPATGLIHMGARMYQPKLGRFLSRDPITGGSANDYEYTSGDPINRLDVSGMHHICTVYQNPNCQTSPEVDRVICEQGIAAGVQEIIDAACHFGDAGDGSGASFGDPTSGRGGIDWPEMFGRDLKRYVAGSLFGPVGWFRGDRVNFAKVARACLSPRTSYWREPRIDWVDLGINAVVSAATGWKGFVVACAGGAFVQANSQMIRG
ncbi:MAG: hypothetical protein DCC49_05525, partial [Acidobacteria bacterium]